MSTLTPAQPEVSPSLDAQLKRRAVRRALTASPEQTAAAASMLLSVGSDAIERARSVLRTLQHRHPPAVAETTWVHDLADIAESLDAMIYDMESAVRDAGETPS